jgi:hypothetical protein
VAGVDTDLRVKPFFAEGSTISIREFVVGALHKEMGMESSTDPDLLTASAGGRVVTPSGMGDGPGSASVFGFNPRSTRPGQPA